jgi:hypothetical protein
MTKQTYQFESLYKEIAQLKEEGEKLKLPGSLLKTIAEEEIKDSETAAKATGTFKYQLKNLNEKVG